MIRKIPLTYQAGAVAHQRLINSGSYWTQLKAKSEAIINDGNSTFWYKPTESANITAVAGVESIYWDMLYGKEGALGAEQSSGVIVKYAIYKITATQADFFYTGCQIGDVFACETVKTCTVNNKVQRYTGNHLTQPVVTNRPTNCSFDGVDNFMKTAPFTYIQPEMLYLVVKQKTTLSGKYMIDGATTNKGLLGDIGTSQSYTINAYAGTWSGDNNNLGSDVWGIVRLLFNGASSKLQVNDTTPVTWNCGANNMGGFTFGSVGAGTSAWADCEVQEIIGRKVADSTADEADIYAYLKYKWLAWMNTASSNKVILSCTTAAINLTATIRLTGFAGYAQCWIDWGDESSSMLTMDETLQTKTHKYLLAGTRSITIYNASSLHTIDLSATDTSYVWANISAFNKAINLKILKLSNNNLWHTWSGDIMNLSATLEQLWLYQMIDITGDIAKFVNLTHLHIQSNANNTCTIGGSVTGLTKLKWLIVFGENTLSGEMGGCTELRVIFTAGHASITCDVTNLVNLCNLENDNATTCVFSGSINNLVHIGETFEGKPGFVCMDTTTILSGDLTNCINAIYWTVGGFNTITGDISAMTNIRFLGFLGNNTVFGSIANLLHLEVWTKGGLITKPTTVINNPELIFFAPGYAFTVTEVNQILADMWANRDHARPEITYTGRIIDLTGSAAPTGQGLTDKAALQAYRSPNNDPAQPLWTVYTA